MTHSDPNQRLEALLEQALELAPAERSVFLDEACGGDHALRERLESLLATESEMGPFLGDPTLGDDELTAESDALIGSMIGPYKLLQALGEGGYGVVYLAEQREPVNRRVALKVIKLGMDTRQVIARFEAERQALAMMEHPNIAKVLDAGATETGRPYFVMELVRGVPITEYCDSCKLTTEKRLRLFTQVCRAVHHAHQKGVIHRDIKPNNIMVTLHDGEPVPKVIDFGIAKATNIRLTEKTLFTDFRQFVGTPAYTSPEQVEMSGLDVDTRSDIYSLGVLLYELLTGTTPVEAETLKKAAYAEIQRTIIESEPPTPSRRMSTLANERQLEVAAARAEIPNKLRQRLRGDLDWIAMKALEKDRARRYESASAFAQDIDRFLTHEPVYAAAPSAVYRLKKFVHRNKAVASVAAALLLGSVVSITSGIHAMQSSRLEKEARLEAEASDARAQRNLYIADMNVAQDAFDSNNLDRAIKLLNRHRPQSPTAQDYRGFEWRYLRNQTHRELFTLDTGGDAIYTIAVSPNDQLLASASRDGIIRLWDLASRTLIHTFDLQLGGRGRYGFVDFSPDSNALAACADSHQGAPSDLVVWDINSRQETHRFSTAPGLQYYGLGFAPDGLLVTATNHPKPNQPAHFHYFDLSTGSQEVERVYEHPVIFMDMTQQSPFLVASFADHQVGVWDLRTRQWRMQFNGAPWKIYPVTISADGRSIAGTGYLTSSPARSYIWDVESPDNPLHSYDYDVPSHGEVFSPDGRTLAIEEMSGRIHLLDTRSGERVSVYDQSALRLTSVAFTSNNQLILSADESGRILGWPGRSSLDRHLLHVSEAIVAIRYSPNGKYLAAGMMDGSVDVFDTDSMERVLAVPAIDWIRAPLTDDLFLSDFFAFDPKSERIAIGGRVDPSKDSTKDLRTVGQHFRLTIRDLESAEEVNQLPHPAFVRSVAWASDGTLATGTDWEGGKESGTGEIRLWNASLTDVKRQLGIPSGVVSLTFSQDSRLLAGTGYGNTGIQIWDARSGDAIARLTDVQGYEDDTRGVAFSPDGGLMAVLGADGTVYLYETERWELLHEMSGHGPGMDLVFSPDGSRLASSGYESLCKLWDVDTGYECASFPGIVLDFAPDGKTLAIGGSWRIPIGEDPDSKTIRLIRAPALDELKDK